MNIKPTWQTISTITAMVIAITTGVWKAAPVVTKLGELYDNADILLKQKEVLESLKLNNDDLKTLHAEFHNFKDTTEFCIDLLVGGKPPYDSVYIVTRHGWKIFQKDDPQILKYRK